MSSLFLSIQGSYQHVQVALFFQSRCLNTLVKSGNKASSYLISYFDELLGAHCYTLDDVSFIALDRGPGAFTSLRVAIATVNGIGFARQVPLIGINGLEALYQEARVRYQEKDSTIVCLLNAYNHDVYFYLQNVNQEKTEVVSGCKNIDLFLEYLQNNYQHQKLCFTGNAAILHKDLIMQKIGSQAVIDTSAQEVASAYQIGIMGYDVWQKQTHITYKIVPNYVKTQNFALKI